MNTLLSPPAVERAVRCWCGNARLEDFSPDYWLCAECQTLVLQAMPGEEISQVRDDEHDFYGKSYYQRHVQEDYGLPDLPTRARADLPERCLFWLKTLLKYVSGPGAHTLELGCGHGGFVAMQRWAGLDAVGLELSPWLVQQACEWFGVPVIEGRLEDQQLAPASWDAVVLMDVLEHLPDPRRTLRAAAGLLRTPESFLLIQTPCYPAGLSYAQLCAQNHPFLQMLRPMEHLYLFSERSVARLCAELGVGQVRFEPAIFGHYDLFAVASAGALAERSLPERTQMLMAASPPARWTLALLDLGVERDAAHARAGDLQGHISRAEADAGARLRQVEELADRLAASETDRTARLHQVEELAAQLKTSEADRSARQEQVAELAALLKTSETDRTARLRQVEELAAQLKVSEADRSARQAQVIELTALLKTSETDRDARQTQVAELTPLLKTSETDRAARQVQVIELTALLKTSETDRAARAGQIEQLTAWLLAKSADCDAQAAHIQELTARLEGSEAVPRTSHEPERTGAGTPDEPGALATSELTAALASGTPMPASPGGDPRHGDPAPFHES